MTLHIILVVFFVMVGVGLLLLELFLLPGFGVAGVGGVLSLIAGVVYAYIKLSAVYPWAGHITLIAALVLSAIAIYIFMKSNAIEKMGLDTTIDSSVEMPSAGKHMEEMSEAIEKEENAENE